MARGLPARPASAFPSREAYPARATPRLIRPSILERITLNAMRCHPTLIASLALQGPQTDKRPCAEDEWVAMNDERTRRAALCLRKCTSTNIGDYCTSWKPDDNRQIVS